jgi:hypothetical protein
MECAELEFKPDWPLAARRLEAWWDGAIVDRAVIQVTAPREGVLPREIPAPPTLVERWTNVDYVLEVALERMRSTYYGGDAFPCYFPNIGPDAFAAYLGSPLEFGETTSWSHPIIEDWGAPPSFRLDRENPWWKLTVEMTRRAARLAAGRFIVGITDLHGTLDTVVALRHPQEAAMDVIEHPAELKRAVIDLVPAWKDVYEGLRTEFASSSPGTTTWLSAWHPGRCYPVSCDFICMISPASFREFVVPELVAEIEWLDRSVFHLDGPDAIKHLDALFELPRISAIQWVPGEKIPRQAMTDWIPLLQRIQAAGRGLHLNVVPEEVEPLLTALRPEGLLLQTRCESEQDADALVALATKLTARRSHF